MHRYIWLLGLLASLAACGSRVNVEQERNNLLTLDREWSQSTKDLDKFVSYYASDASVYAPGMPVVTGSAPIRETFSKMTSTPGFSLQWTPAAADVSSSGDLGYTTGTYEMSMGGPAEKGKYVEVWKKQQDGQWKVTNDIFNADTAPQAPKSQEVLLSSTAVKWGDPPPVLPAGAKMAVISGDPGSPAPFAIRLQMPAGYRIAPHWHPGDEHVTVLSGTFSLGMGEKFDPAVVKDLPTGGYALLPAEMRHFAVAKTAATVQVQGMGPFAFNYVNPADDPSQKK